MLQRPHLILALIILAACAAKPPQPAATPVAALEAAAPGESGFDKAQAEALLARAKQAEARNPAEAERLYRQAGMAWPDLTDAWDGLRRVAARQNNMPEAAAASFVAERVKLYPGTALVAQREVNMALHSYLQDQQKQPTDSPQQLAYAKRLGEFYDAQYVEAGFYQREKHFGNISRHDLPGVLISVGGIAGYAISLATRFN